MSYAFTLSDTIPAAPRAIYDAWLDGPRHSAMTGGKAEAAPAVGGTFTAWDGYISGRNLELEPGVRIVQSWRTTNFTDEQPDSRITVILVPVAGGTLLTLRHENVPEDQPGYENGGWQDHYFTPMKAYFAR
ncbi:MAG: Activator of ATPase [Rhodospirillales bacterium]|jgi:activator of HSP90 ATPase|nr:Activator of ATPase [Rhodospirillales bacterium]